MKEQPNLNTGQPWSIGEAIDLRICLDRGKSVTDIADFLCRTENEIRHQIIVATQQAAKNVAEEAEARSVA